jgi:hypothetical protein
MLCVSFHPSRGAATMFEPYFLVPWLLAVDVVLLEIGIIRRRAALVRWMMATPLSLLMLSTWTAPVPYAIGLRPMLLESIGCSPLFLTLMAATLLYTVAWMRGVRQAVHWLTAAIALLVVVGPHTTGLAGPYSLCTWPLVLLAALQLVVTIHRRSGVHAMLAAVSTIGAACIAWPQDFATRWGGAIPVHLLLLAALLIGAVLRDRAARFLQQAAVLGVLAVCVYAISGDAEPSWQLPPRLMLIYPGVMLLLLAAYGALLGDRRYWAGSLAMLVCWGIILAGRGYRVLRGYVAGLDQISLGMACLLVGLLVSLGKLGVPQAWMSRWFNRRPPRVVSAGSTAQSVETPLDDGPFRR